MLSLLMKRILPLLLLCFTVSVVVPLCTPDYADARSRSGGRSFSSPAAQPSPAPSSSPSMFGQQRQTPQTPQQSGGFGKGLMGGLIGGALGSMLFGSMFGMGGGSGMGMLLPLLLLGGVGYFLYKRFANRPPASPIDYQRPVDEQFQKYQGDVGGNNIPPIPPIREARGAEHGLAMIRLIDPDFDEKHFVEVASDVFFQVQAGWMRRDLASYRHLLGKQLAEEYERHFAELRNLGHINKLESIAIRKVEIVSAGSENNEDFVTVLFAANLLDYTVDEKSGALVSGSMTEPVKFAEHWTWTRPTRTNDWKLEGIEVAEG
jgi:predicted lipid-binding transport protein (Tim44 family)